MDRTKLLHLILFFMTVILGSAALANTPPDHFGPDPMQSENCLLVVPGYSILCRGRYHSEEIAGNPTIIFSCVPGIYLILTHEANPNTWPPRETTRDIEFAGLEMTWLAVSEYQSAHYIEPVYRDGSYERTSLLDVLFDISERTISEIEYTYRKQTGSERHTSGGKFEFDVSDAFMLLGMIERCRL